ncbi:PEP-CTERM sorting domain-containing protein [Caldimonas brevitalea]|uniref:PEP-CTERM protein-sorting domain-containing protein n=1 Tax=Caldimonas brevitalea TaxID=413882 RepID=A0A0G3BLZ2_9BURK|nr:PEP-CTERM sorting domain-containing protein [Caldimonas brevitalea]AKJ27580.1 hypothetical protein AAW51_0889 [Caldimonas brevitalea]
MNAVRFLFHTLAGLALGAALMGPVQAVPFPDDGTDAVTQGVSILDDPTLEGTLLDSHVARFDYSVPTVDPFGWTPSEYRPMTGTVESRVVRSDLLGTLDFYWTISVDASVESDPILKVNQAIADGFARSLLTGVDWRSDLPGDVPLSSAFRSDQDGVVFQFIPPQMGAIGVGSGESSHSFFLRTNATEYALNGQFTVSTGGFLWTDTVGTLAPVPEPASGLLLLLGCCVLTALSRGRRGR